MPFKCVVPGCRSNYYHVKGTPSIPMMKFPADPGLIAEWSKAIHRLNFEPTPHSHVCIKHFTEDELMFHEFQRQSDGTLKKVKRRHARLRPLAVPSIFEVDPSTHVVRSHSKPAKRHMKPKPLQPRCEILTGYQVKEVEFKPEMWEDVSEKTKEKKTTASQSPVKRGRGRPRKHPTTGTKVIDHDSDKTEFVSCCALACTNTSESYIMNCLPQNSALRESWVNNIDRLDWMPDEDSALCEIHFDAEMWDNAGDEKILKLDAVPTLFLHGEAIKSWVTMDNSGKVEKVVVGKRGAAEAQDSEDEEDSEFCVKGEDLVPEIAMVEGVEDVLSCEASSTEEHFETIYCDSTFNELTEDSDDERYAIHIKEEAVHDGDLSSTGDYDNPLEPDCIFSDVSSMNHTRVTPVIQDEEVSCISDTSDQSVQELKMGDPLASNYLVISRPNYLMRKKIKRRTSSELTTEFQCPVCTKKLSRRKNLEIHMQKLHPNGATTDCEKRRKVTDELQNGPHDSTLKKPLHFKKPPPALNPIVPQCLIASPSPTASTALTIPGLAPLVAVPTSLTTSSTLLATSTVVAASSSSDPSPSGGEVKKQFLLLLPKPPTATVPMENSLPTIVDDSKYYVDMSKVPQIKRNILKEKLKELVDAVVSKNLEPDKIIIAYDRT